MISALDEFTLYLVAYLLQAVIFGITVAQTVIYFLKNNDGWQLRAFVAALFALNALSMAFIGHSVHSYVLRLGGVFSAKLLWTSGANVEVINVTIVLVQLFFARQVYLFSQRSKLIPLLAVVFALASLGFGTAVAVNNIMHASLVTLGTIRSRVYILCASFLSAASDVVSVGAMCWELIESRDTLLKTRSVVAFLLCGTFNRGLVVLVWQFLWCIWAAVTPTVIRWAPLLLSLPGVYTNTCLAMLNCRPMLRSKIDSTRVLDEGAGLGIGTNGVVDLEMYSDGVTRPDGGGEESSIDPILAHARRVSQTSRTSMARARGEEALGKEEMDIWVGIERPSKVHRSGSGHGRGREGSCSSTCMPTDTHASSVGTTSMTVRAGGDEKKDWEDV